MLVKIHGIPEFGSVWIAGCASIAREISDAHPAGRYVFGSTPSSQLMPCCIRRGLSISSPARPEDIATHFVATLDPSTIVPLAAVVGDTPPTGARGMEGAHSSLQRQMHGSGPLPLLHRRADPYVTCLGYPFLLFELIAGAAIATALVYLCPRLFATQNTLSSKRRNCFRSSLRALMLSVRATWTIRLR